jgi:AsmA-like C-terminal region/AsmA family
VSNIATDANAGAGGPQAAPIAAAARPEPLAQEFPRRRIWRRAPRWILLFLSCLWLADSAISLAIQHTRLRGKLTSHLETAFGRRVEVGSYGFSLWGGPTLEARSVIVGEDPRFGEEYFLRADVLTMRLRWLNLLRGRLDLGAVSLSRPSLNLVRNTDGDWNLAEWLPRPSNASAAGMGPATPSSLAMQAALRFTRIDVDSGRINFKRGDEKLPFAFVGVNGRIEPEGSGRWRMDLEATPSRAAVEIQQPGTLHLIGHVGGTSSRLRPAVLEISWGNASVSDVLRLARSYDYGVRGTFALALSARTEANDWLLESRTELRQLHRWDLPMRADNPALNLIAEMSWNPLVPALYVEDATLETPHSNMQIRHAGISWGASRILQKRPVAPFSLEVQSAVIDLGDLLSWVRAFHSGVADNLSLQGVVEARGYVSGWPLQLVKMYADGVGADLNAPGLRVPVHLGEIEFHYDHGLDFLDPLTLSFGATEGTLRLEAARKPQTSGLSSLRLSGNLKQARDLISTAAALGWNISRGWSLAGPLRGDLRWSGGLLPWQSPPVGFVEWGGAGAGASLAAPFLNRPVEAIKARADWKPGLREVSLSSAEAFGARWTGTFDRRESDSGWKFALSADHLAAADLDRWLNPRWRESFLDRMLPFLNDRARANAAPENLRASGRIAVDQFTLAPLVTHKLQGDVAIEGRHLRLANARATFYDGSVTGLLDATLGPAPSYHASLDFSGVDLTALTSAAPNVANLFAGSASGKIAFDARGATREDLVGSLACEGSARIEHPELREIDLPETLRETAIRPGSTLSPLADAVFTCSQRVLQIQRLEFTSPGGGIEVWGSADFAHNLDFRLVRLGETHHPVGSPYHLTGTLAAPRITRATAPPARP